MFPKIVFAALVLIAFSSCEEGWTDEYKQQYRQSCLEGSNVGGMDAAQKEKYCNCTLEVTMKHYKTITEVVENKDSTQVGAEVELCRGEALK